MNETTTLLGFLQQNASWICGFGMLVFAIVQVCLMFVQGRQQIRLQRLDLAQKFNAIYTKFPRSKKECVEFLHWLITHEASFRFLLKDKDLKEYYALYDLVLEFWFEKNKRYFRDIKKQDVFYACAIVLESSLRNASYGIPKRHSMRNVAQLIPENKRKRKLSRYKI